LDVLPELRVERRRQRLGGRELVAARDAGYEAEADGSDDTSHGVGASSAQRERHRDLMRGRADLSEAERTARCHQDAAACDGEVALREEHTGRLDARPAGAVGGPPAVANLELREAKTQTPGGRPLAPSLFQVARGGQDVVVLRQPVAHGADYQAQLQAQRLSQ